MDKFSLSRQPKKSCNGSTVAAVNSIYDDIFGGPPRFGAPTRTTLSPHVDDYTEIFGAFHAPRATSIPVLDLPAVDEAEVFFDVRSSGFEYSEIFGGLDGSDFAVPFEELMLIDQSNGRNDGSSDEAWTPEAEYLSEESDHSVKNSRSLSGDFAELIHSSTEFNISYHQVGRRSNENIENGITRVVQPTVPECTFAVDQAASAQSTDDECSSLQQVDDACSNSTTIFSGEGGRERDLRKMFSQPASAGVSGSLYGVEGRPHKGYVGNSSLPNEMFYTISDVSLRTQPSQLPPPSRPPPPPSLDDKRVCSAKPTSDYRWLASEGSGDDGSPPYFDVEIDASSSAEASAAAAMLEAMEKAQAKLNCVKESMERKREGFLSHTKSFLKNDRKNDKGKVTRMLDDHSIAGESVYQRYGEIAENQSDLHEFEKGRKVTRKTWVIPEPAEEKKQQTVGRVEAGDRRITGESGQIYSERADDQMDFYEFEGSRKVTRKTWVIPEPVEGKKKETVGKYSDEKCGSKLISFQGSDRTNEAAEWKEETCFFELVSTNKSTLPIDQTNSKNNLVQSISIHEARNTIQKSGKLQAPQELPSQSRPEKKYSVDHNCSISDKRQTSSHDSGKYENMVKDEREAIQVEDKNLKHKKKNNETYRSMWNHENLSCENQYSDYTQGVFFEEKIQEKHNQVHEQVKDERVSNDKMKQEKMEVAGREENKKKTAQARERENNQKKLMQEDIERVKEALGKESEMRQREVNKWEETKKLGKSCESTEDDSNKEVVSEEDEERRRYDTQEKQENKKRLKEALKREETERRQKEIHERMEKEMRVRETFERELTEPRTRETFQRGHGKRLEAVNEHSEKGKAWLEIQEEEECELKLGGRRERDLGCTTQEAINFGEPQVLFNNIFENMEEKKPNENGQDCNLSDEEYAADIHKKSCGSQLSGERQDGTKERDHQEIGRLPTELQNSKIEVDISKNGVAFEANSELVDEKTDVCSATHGNSENLKNKFPCMVDSLRKKAVASHCLGENDDEKINICFSMSSESSNKAEAPQVAKLEVKENYQQTHRHANEGKSTERKLNSESDTVQGVKGDKIRKKDLECLKKMEEEIDREREREREREKDRMTIDRKARVARDKAISEARERAQWATVERAMSEARERLEEACAEARERSIPDKTSVEARIKVERSATERAATEARGASEEVITERAASGERNMDLQDQSAGPYNCSRYAYSSNYSGSEGESAQRCRARLERHRRTAERAAKALAEKNKRDLLAQKEQAERKRIAETLDADVKRWSSGKEGNLRALLSTLQYILGPSSGWQPIPLTEVITSSAAKRAYRKAMLCIHPDKLQQRGASIQQKYVCEKVFDLLKEAWNRFNSEER